MSRRRPHFATVLATLAVIAVVATAMAQTTTGTILGVVQDEQQAVMPNVTVTSRNVETNAVRSVITDSAGRFRFPYLSVSRYEVTFERAGFARRLSARYSFESLSRFDGGCHRSTR